MAKIVGLDKIFFNNIVLVTIVFVFLSGAFYPAVNSQVRSFVFESEKGIFYKDESLIISDSELQTPMLLDPSDPWWKPYRRWDYDYWYRVGDTTDNVTFTADNGTGVISFSV